MGAPYYHLPRPRCTRLPLPYAQCTAPGKCTLNGAAVLDANWMWLHKKGDYHNCYTGDNWNKQFCPDPKTCADTCALDAGGAAGAKNARCALHVMYRSQLSRGVSERLREADHRVQEHLWRYLNRGRCGDQF